MCVSYENNVLKRSTFSLAEDYSISCKTANLLSFLEKLVTMVTENTEKNSKKGGGIQKQIPQLFLVILSGSSATMTAGRTSHSITMAADLECFHDVKTRMILILHF